LIQPTENQIIESKNGHRPAASWQQADARFGAAGFQ
jgi:hypothetical protein